ncbi:MAG: nitrogenase [Tannerellaceae bacterium]|jgi:nitrogenase molybdenum-iron protein NifN|nr:nitrogenase [Tannerellaceae bacterium]
MENTCKQCAPLGACVAFKGIEGALPMLHGSQGCATYIRRYLISHFRESVDIASSNFSEATTIFGGNRNFNTGIDNIIRQYHPHLIAIASTCLAETIGEDVHRLIFEYRNISDHPDSLPPMVFASTPSYKGSHYEGFHLAVAAVIKALADKDSPAAQRLNLFSNFISPEDIRLLKHIAHDFRLDAMTFPDYSDTLDGIYHHTYHRIPPGGTPLAALRSCCHAHASIELGYILNAFAPSAGEFLRDTFAVPLLRTGLPIGIAETDRFFDLLSQVAGRPVPEKYLRQRGRLIDLYIDGHKYVSGKRALIYGEEDLVVALAAFAAEVGIRPLLCASGGESGRLEETLRSVLGDLYPGDLIVGQGMSFDDMRLALLDARQTPDILIGNSKGYYLARLWDVPLVRVGFPIHDRIGAQHQLLLAYQGSTLLFERIVNALLDAKQRSSPVGYKYM